MGRQDVHGNDTMRGRCTCLDDPDKRVEEAGTRSTSTCCIFCWTSISRPQRSRTGQSPRFSPRRGTRHDAACRRSTQAGMGPGWWKGSSGWHLRHDPTFVDSRSRLVDAGDAENPASPMSFVWKKQQTRSNCSRPRGLKWRWYDATRGLGLPVFTRAVARRAWRGKLLEKGAGCDLPFECLQLAASRLTPHKKIDCVAGFACRVQTHEPGLRKRGQQHKTLGVFPTDQSSVRCASVGFDGRLAWPSCGPWCFGALLVHAEKRPRPYPAMSRTHCHVSPVLSWSLALHSRIASTPDSSRSTLCLRTTPNTDTHPLVARPSSPPLLPFFPLLRQTCEPRNSSSAARDDLLPSCLLLPSRRGPFPRVPCRDGALRFG